jgi:sialidase-1
MQTQLDFVVAFRFVFTPLIAIAAAIGLAESASAANRQWVEGFAEVEFHHDANGSTPTRDFRGSSRGYMTAGWWAPGEMKKNYVAWKTAPVPAKKETTFVFIAATSVLPSEFSRGPTAKLSVNGKEVLEFTIGVNQDRVWKQGDYELKYISKRVEYPYFGSHRELRELNGNSGIFQLTVPASAVEANRPETLKVEILPFARWAHGWFMVKERRDALDKSIETLEGEVESLRQDVAVLNEQTHTLATKLYGDLSGNNRFEHTVIYQNGYKHVHPADLIQLRNGELLLMAREGTEHISNDGDVIMLRSKDQGKNWGEKQTIGAIKDLDEREGCGIQLKGGTIVLGIFYNNLYDEDGRYNSKRVKESDQRTSEKRHRLGAYIITSRDNGHTWTEPKFIETNGMPFSNLEGPTDAPIQMPDGSVVMGVIAYGLQGDAADKASVLLRSTDVGQTWKYVSTIADDPGGKLGGFVEPGIVRTKTGRIVAGLRNHGPENAIWTTYSDDDGKNWTPVKKTEMIGHPVDLIQLSDGRLMASYGVRTEHARPEGVRACFSSDNGATWDIQTEVQIRNDFANWDVGYPESLELPDGRVLTVYYGNLFGKYFLGGTYWKP